MEEGEVADKTRGRSVDDPGDGEHDDDRVADVDDEFDAAGADDAFTDDADDDADADTDMGGRAGAGASAAGRRGSTSVPARAAAKAASRTKVKENAKSVGIFARLGRFVREIIAELQKVIWPTRKELLTYTTVVVVFVAIMMTFVALLDVGFAKAMFLVFGTSDTATN